MNVHWQFIFNVAEFWYAHRVSSKISPLKLINASKRPVIELDWYKVEKMYFFVSGLHLHEYRHY